MNAEDSSPTETDVFDASAQALAEAQEGLEEIDIDNIHGGRTLLIDGDIIIYKPCCVLNEDDEYCKAKIQEIVQNQITTMMRDAECDRYQIFLTTSTNFRDFLVDDYKANRKDVERPVNLAWTKKWAVANLNAVWHTGLEADDLLGIYQTDKTVIWSLDKDLRQIPGLHLDDETKQVITVTKLGMLQDRGKKIYFDGECGFFMQLLTGDTADHIVGCGKRVESIFKSGAKKGQSRVSRKGIGPKAALAIIRDAVISVINEPVETQLLTVRVAVCNEYRIMFGEEPWFEMMETQANLLFMVREQYGEVIKQWTIDDRDQWFDIKKGVVLHDFARPTDT